MTRPAPHPEGEGGSEGAWDRLRKVASETGRTVQQRPSTVGEVAELSALLDLVALADRAVMEAVELLIDLRTNPVVETATGVGIELWLAQIARRTHADVRMLQLAADLLPRLPGTRQAFGAGRLSWSQLRAILLAIRQAPVGTLDDIDDHVCGWLEHSPHADPDAITTGISTLLWQLDTDRRSDELDRAERDAQATQYLAMQPRLDGTGGRIWGEFAAPGFATLDAALNHGLKIPAGHGDFDQPGDRAAQGASAGQQRARRLIGWADQHLTAADPRHHTANATPDDNAAASEAADTASGHVDEGMSRNVDGQQAGSETGTSRRRGPASARPTVLLRTSLDTLLGGQLPGELLTHLAGGRLHVTSATSRRIIDEGGADLRMIVLDATGSVVGVGDRAYVPPGWVSDVGAMMTATCEAPGCNVAVRVAQDDHARPWNPLDPAERRGHTDVSNVGRLCARHNRTKERAGWHATRTADGTRRWHHPRSGLTATHHPDHWQPPPPTRDNTPHRRPPRNPAGTDADADDPADTPNPGDVDRDDQLLGDWLDPPDPDLPF